MISRATIYKNLKFLVGKGLIKEVNVKGVARFEYKTTSHHHMICNSFGKIFDFESRELIDIALKLAKNHKDFLVKNAETNFYGLFQECKAKIIP
ncbi:MAG: Fur family transcriptional regulator [Candidatus Hodarchaeales archaeon]